MATPTRPSRRESTAATPTQAPSSPQPSESFLSELDGTAPSVLETAADFQWDVGSSSGPVGRDLVSWRRGSAALGYGVGQAEEGEDGVVDDLPTRGFYAISTVIAHPTKRANPLRSTRKPLPPIGHPAPLPKPPPPSHYDAYLQAVTPLYETFLAARDTEGGQASSGDGSLTGAFDIDVRPVDVKSTLPPLEGIPQSFFDTSFDLADPATWAAITGQPSANTPTDTSTSIPPIPIPNAQQLQESLSTHLDTLERHLIHEITLRSTSFFSALSNLQDLHSESSSCLSRIRKLQAGLRDIGENTAQRGLSIIGKHEDLHVLRATEQGLDELQELEGVMDVTRTFVEADDWLGGLGCLGEIGQWWMRHLPRGDASAGGTAEEPIARSIESHRPDDPDSASATPPRLALPLSILPALSPLPQLFSDLRTQIALQIETSLHSYLLTTLSSADIGLHDGESDTTKLTEANGGETSQRSEGEDGSRHHVNYDSARFREHVRPMVEGLARCGVIDGIEGLWGDVVTLAVREGSRKHLPISQAEEEAEEATTPGHEMRGANLAQALRSMSHPAYLALTSEMYQTMLLRLRLANTVGQDLLHVVQSIGADVVPLSLTRPPHTTGSARGDGPDGDKTSGVGIIVTAGTPTNELPHTARGDVRSPFSSISNSVSPSANASARTSLDGGSSYPFPSAFSTSTFTPGSTQRRPKSPSPTTVFTSGQAASTPGLGRTSQEVTLNLQEVLSAVCDLANLRASKILGVRGEQHAGLKLMEFVQVYKANWDFVMETEGLGGRAIPSLRGVVASQARTFLIAYHSHRLTRSAKLVEEEQWTQIEVSSVVQHAVQLLVEAATQDPGECFVPPRAKSDSAATGVNDTLQTNGHLGDSAAASALSASAPATAKTVDVEDAKFFIVKATAESLELLSDYLAVVINLEVVVTDVMARIIEFLKSFNSRTCQVVLGAGAMRSAGLKNITAKHLALASQSLSIVVSLIPYIREFIRRHLTPKQAVMLTEFDKLKRDYQEHQNEIHAKLVAIMSDRLAVHCGSLRDIDWESAPDKDGPRAYAELLVKETTTLHKVLSKYLAANTVDNVMREVLAAIVHRLSEEYSRIELKSEDAKTRMTQDATLISTRLSPLSEAGTQMTSLETLVKDKAVPRKTVLGGLLKRGSSSAAKKGAADGKDGKLAKGLDEEVGEDDMGDEDDEEGEGQGRNEGDEEKEGAGGMGGVAIEVEAPDAATEQFVEAADQPGLPEKAEGANDVAGDGPSAASTAEVESAAAIETQARQEDGIAKSNTESKANDDVTTPPPALPTKDDPDTAHKTAPPPPPEKPTSPEPAPLATPQPVRMIDTAMMTPPPPQISPKSSTSTALPDIPLSSIEAGAISPIHPTSATSPLSARALSPVGGGSTGSPVSATRTSFSSFAASLRSPPPVNGSNGIATPPPAPGSNATPPASAQATPTRAPRVSLANRLRGVMSRSGSADVNSPPKAQASLPPPPPVLADEKHAADTGTDHSKQRASVEEETASAVTDASDKAVSKSETTEISEPQSETVGSDAVGEESGKPPGIQAELSEKSQDSTSVQPPNTIAADASLGGVSDAQLSAHLPSGNAEASPSTPPAEPAQDVDAKPAEVAAAAPVDVAESAAAALADDAEAGIPDTPAVTGPSAGGVTGTPDSHEETGQSQVAPTPASPANNAPSGTNTGNNSAEEDDEDDADDKQGEAQQATGTQRTPSASPAGKAGNKKKNKKKKGKK